MLLSAFSPAPRRRHRARRSRLFAALSAALVLLVAATSLAGSVLTAPAAFAATGALNVTKTVEAASPLAPGDEFTYTIRVACQDAHCIDATLTDELPPEFEHFEFVGNPQVVTASVATTLERQNCGPESTVGAGCALVVTAVDTLPEGDLGLSAGDGFTTVFTLKVPADLTPAWAYNGDTITNTAGAIATNAALDEGTADVTVLIPTDVDLAVTKDWAPASQQYQPGVQSTLTLGIRNTSNVNAESLVLQDPKVATDAAATLPTSNPFRIVDFVGFGAVAFPQGADQVQVDAYVRDGGIWSWEAGSPSGTAALPTGVAADEVAGLRFTFSDDADQPVIVAGGTAATVPVNVVQRSTDRETGDSLVLGASASNVVTGAVTVPGEDSVSADATAPYVIGGLTVEVVASKTISPANIPAGGTTTGEVSGRNESNGPLASMTISDNSGFFDENVVFAGLEAAPTWPAGATAAEVVWHIDDGPAQTPVPFASGATPSLPLLGSTEHITGFDLVFTGEIEIGATGGATFSIDTTTDLVPDAAASPRALSNAITVTGVNPAGTDSAPADAPLNAYFPSIGLTLDKSVSPEDAVNVGGTVVVQLPAVTSADSQYVRPDSIEITDHARGGGDDFWEAFNPVGIAPTQVLAGSALLVEYTTDGTTWLELHNEPVATTARIVEELITGVPPEDITGLRFTFTDADGFAQATSVTPAIVFEARSTLRTAGTPVADSDTTPTEYTNLAVAQATGKTEEVDVISDVVQADAPAGVVASPGSGVLYAGKKWRNLGGSDKATITSQSGDPAITRLSWGVPTTGFTSVTISDPASDEASPENTTFQAFNLTGIRALSFSSSPLLRWDTVSVIELFDGVTWNEVTAPGGSWMNTTGFTGYALSATEVENTTGVRITVEPNDTAREGSEDSTRPAEGSGIAFGAAGPNRHFDLQWSLRNTLRVPDASHTWATGSTPFNSGTDGLVRNEMRVTGEHPDGSATGTAQDDIELLDFTPAVDVRLDVDPTTLVIPNPGDIAEADYPTVDLTYTAQNDALPRASYLRVSTPACGTAMPGCVSEADEWDANAYTGAVYDAASNPFEQVTLTGLDFTVPSDQVSKDDSLVTLWQRAADGTLRTTVLSITDAEALAPADLAEVVGVSVVYQGADPATNGGSIVNSTDLVMVLHTQVRQLQRSGGSTDFVTPGTINGVAAAQTYDPVLYESGDSAAYASDPGDFTLLGGALDATAGKQFTPSVVLERDRASNVEVLLTATDGASTAPTHRVTITDDDADFWDAVTLTSLGAVTLPNGADRVRVDVQTGDNTWLLGTAAATAALPTGVAPGDVTGIRFIFDRADGELFSTNTLPADWSASVLLNVTLRDTERTSGDVVDFPATIENTVQVESARTEDPVIYVSATDDADDALTLDTGTFGMDVVKSVAGGLHTIDPGEQAAWTLEFTNTGTGFLTVSDLVDTLPSHLTFTGEEPSYATTGTLSTDVVLDTSNASELNFIWPAGGTRMSPGETFTITLTTVLQPGAASPTTNQFVVTVDQTLGTCTNGSGNGQGTLTGLGAVECGTSNFVQPRAGASIVAYKGVKGEIDGTLVDGAVNVSNPTRDCVPDADGYFVSPCAANTVIGATDEWKLQTVNSGTEPVDGLTFVEPLPVAGDRMLATGSARGSDWRPVFDSAFGVNASEVPTGTSVSWEVSTDSELCVGTGSSTWPGDPTCAANDWVVESAFTGDWASVTGLRIAFDFTGTATGMLEAGESVTTLFRTINEPATTVDPTLAPVTVPASDSFAWNQFGATATFPSDPPMRRAPIKAGVTLPTGQLDVAKQVTGGAAAFAPTEFLVDVTCTIAGVPMNLGTSAQLALQDASGLAATVDGVPLGAQCTVSEVGDVGEYDETSRIGDDAVTSIMTPAAQTVTITNDYEWGQLSVTKSEDRSFASMGQAITYTIVVANEGPRTAHDQLATDLLPAGANLVSTTPVATQVGNELSWQIDELGPGDSVTYTVVVDYSDSGTFINRATVTNPPGPWQPVTPEEPCADDPEGACSTVTIAALTVTGIVWLDVALIFAGLLTIFGLLVLMVVRRMAGTR